MPNLPYGISHDRTQLFKDSGADVMLTLGKTLIDLGQGIQSAAFRTLLPDGPVPGDVADCETAVREFFDSNPRAKLRPMLLPKSGQKAIDMRICRVVAVLAAHHVLEGGKGMPVMALARVCAAGGPPGEVLEWRRVIAVCGVDELVQVADNAGLFAEVMLGTEVLIAFLGGEACVPVLGDTVFAQLAEQRRRHCAMGQAKPKVAGRPTDAASFVRTIPVLRPREMFDELSRRGYVGQEAARRTLCVAAYRNVQRLRRVFIDGTPPILLPNRENALCRSPTGTGKTLMMRLLCEILGLPHVSIDLTQYSETGYVGEDPIAIVTRLILSAGNASVAQLGAVHLDEVDKIAEPPSGSRMSHVSRHGVQRSLLKLLEPGVIDVPVALGHPFRVPRVRFDTTHLWWIATGAFSGWEEATGGSFPIGFGTQGRGRDARDRQSVKGYSGYGLMPELVARFPLWLTMKPLERSQLQAILGRAVMLYSDELDLDGVKLRIDPDVLDLIVDRAVERGTNARGLQAELCDAIGDAAFEAYSDVAGGTTIRLHAEDGNIAWDVTRKPKGTQMTMQEIKAVVESAAEQEASA